MSHLAFKKKKTEQEKKPNKILVFLLKLNFYSYLLSNKKILKKKSTHCQLVSGGGKSPIVVNVNVDQ